ncbi:universal stress protein [Flavobacterium sp. CS20]|uniref:universal stress protein n=1 Tax=Flavobacterium sp. CS20 TaxID=2775246 RepID=UPI001B3A009F|nr:universal stress protein [Flavobacterium sp. CS20]QTY28039.1 universal stress protein [Flavobacterium sp. CS20]
MQVLLLTDFSKNAKITQEYALNFFGEEDVHFVLFHAMKPCKTSTCNGICAKKRERNLLENEHNLEPKLKPNHTLSKVFIKNNLVDAVRNYIDKNSVDMILMGGKGKTSDEDRQFGKNTFDIVTKIKCPILVVFENSVIKIPNHIVFPLDYGISFQYKYFKTISQLVFWKKINLSILEVPNRILNNLLFKKNNKDKIAKTFKEINFQFKPIQSKDKKAIYEACLDADMIMFMAKNLSISNQIFQQLNTKNLNQQAPLLVLHA